MTDHIHFIMAERSTRGFHGPHGSLEGYRLEHIAMEAPGRGGDNVVSISR
jgi:hypothetical protein